ncbi:MAG: M48 family metallopeptidase [Bacteroidales bacterium]|nr:M48 family metallopeptidase [Bacteroidales bacterium]
MFFYFRRRRRRPANTPEIERMRSEAQRILPPRLQELARQYGFTYHQLRIKHNVSNWGSCSVKGNINLNLHLVRLPAELQDYVMLHELCHLREMNHGPKFHALLESVCPDHRKRAQALREYKLY